MMRFYRAQVIRLRSADAVRTGVENALSHEALGADGPVPCFEEHRTQSPPFEWTAPVPAPKDVRCLVTHYIA